MIKYFPKDDIIALAGQIVPEGYELREIRQQWIPADKEDGVRSYLVDLTFGFEGRFWTHCSGHHSATNPLCFLGDWDEETVPAWEVRWDDDLWEWEAVNEN